MSDPSANPPAAPDPGAAAMQTPLGPADGPLLTICVPTYMRPETLAQALRSAVGGDVDLAGLVSVVISDNSPTQSGPVVRRFTKTWPGSVTYIPNATNIGQIPNINQSLQRATGRWLLMLHDDDELVPGGLRHVVQELASGPGEDVLLFGVRVVDGRGRMRRHQAFPARRHLPPAAALQRLLTDSSFVRMPAIVIRRSAMIDAGFFDVAVGPSADFDLFVRLFARHGVTCVPGDAAIYAVHEEAATATMFAPQTIEAQMDIFERAAATGVLASFALRRARVDWFHQFILGGAYRQLRAGHVDLARSTMGLFRLPAVRALGRSRRWWLLRAGVGILLRLPDGVVARVMRLIGRFAPERLWLR